MEKIPQFKNKQEDSPKILGELNIDDLNKFLSELESLSLAPHIFLECINEYLHERENENFDKTINPLNRISAERVYLNLRGKLGEKIEKIHTEIVNLVITIFKDNRFINEYKYTKNISKKDTVDESSVLSKKNIPEKDTTSKKSVMPEKGSLEYKKMMSDAFHHEKESLPTKGSHDDDL